MHFGEISARQIWNAVQGQFAVSPAGEIDERAEPWLRQLVWREFAHHLLFHFPHTANRNLRDDFDCFDWNEDAHGIQRWERGETGYPIVDAGMRELWTTGWMHNRVRMIAGSFLVKHIGAHWLHGARWFWDTLVDADLANNTMGWQWVAGTGADAAPYFRIFNPLTQAKRFDPAGDYVSRWLPELAALPQRYIHAPWMAPANVLHDAGVVLSETYPEPMLDLKIGRDAALKRYQERRQS